jgi:hypothetical protein
MTSLFRRNSEDRLSPAASPGGFRSGVRRVNDMPLILTGVALAGFLGIMAMVAMDRARHKLGSDDEKTKAGNASLFASSITGKYQKTCLKNSRRQISAVFHRRSHFLMKRGLPGESLYNQWPNLLSEQR